MSDVITLSQRMKKLDVSPQFSPYSKVSIKVSDDTVIEAGNDTGRTLDLTNPFGTQAMAENILALLTGFQYQPYEAQGAILDPAAEIGDGANMRGIYGGIYKRERTFGRLMAANIAAPHDEEVNHEYPFESPQNREFKRQINDVKASLIVAYDNIEAKVSQESPEGQSAFAWKLFSNSHKWYANGNEVMSISASGLKVKGEVEADSGKIGNFNISASAIWNNLSSFGGSQSSGVYVGTDGIQLGQNFKVDSSGNAIVNRLVANNATINGTLSVGGNSITAYQLSSGAYSAYSNGSYWSGGSGYGYNYNNATVYNTGNYPAYFTAGQVRARNSLIGASITSEGSASIAGNTTLMGGLTFGGYGVSWKTVTINGTTIRYLGR